MIKIAVLFYLAALTLFFAAEGLSLLAISNPEKIVFQLGAFALLASFAIMFITLLVITGRRVMQGICHFFSGTETLQRRNWFYQGKIEQQHRLFSHRMLKNRYFHEVKRKRLARANDRKHSRSLAKAIEHDLTLIKTHVPAAQFKAWRHQNNRYRRQADIEGLIALQQMIISQR